MQVQKLSYKEVRLLWRWRASARSHNAIWNATPLCLMCLLWRERNSRAFEDLESHFVELKMLLRTLFHWMAALSSHSLHSVFDLIDSSFLLCLFLVYLLCTRPFILLSMKFYYLTKKKKKSYSICMSLFCLSLWHYIVLSLTAAKIMSYF